MFVYEYVTVGTEMSGWGPVNGTYYSIAEDYHKIIADRAANGWRYVGYIPTKQRSTGHIQELELIFEKEE